MTRHWQVFLLAVQFLTRLPVPKDLPFSQDRLNDAMPMLPLVGALIGIAGAAALWAAALVWPLPLAAVLSTAATIALTGAFHEDGLADAADGIGGGSTRAKALEIMRDSRIGSYGAVSLGLTLGAKIVALSALPVDVAMASLIAAHVISRYGAVLVMFRASYAREEGSKFAAPTVSPRGHAFAACCAAVAFFLLWIVLGQAALAGGILAVLLGWIATKLYLRKLEGFTGDCLGATQQMVELGLLLGVLAWL